jgi:hypothetical protein
MVKDEHEKPQSEGPVSMTSFERQDIKNVKQACYNTNK